MYVRQLFRIKFYWKTKYDPPLGGQHFHVLGQFCFISLLKIVMVKGILIFIFHFKIEKSDIQHLLFKLRIECKLSYYDTFALKTAF